MNSAAERWDRIRLWAAAEGISLAGPAGAGPLESASLRFRDWVARGHHAGLSWLAAGEESRRDPRVLLPGCQSAAVFGFPYHPDAVAGPAGHIARYAAGLDYHPVIRAKLGRLLAGLRLAEPGLEGRVAVDTLPILEKPLAARAGLGWIGKNTCLIHPQYGSFFCLGVLLLNRPLPPPSSLDGDCGDCRRCLDACPTGAIQSPGFLDCRRCLSYLTIEHRGVIPADYRGRLDGNWFGCDRCQSVCPYNRPGQIRPLPEFAARPEVAGLTPAELCGLGSRAFRRRLGQTVLVRATQAGLLRNMVASGWGRPEMEMPADLIRQASARFPLVLDQYQEFYGRGPLRA